MTIHNWGIEYCKSYAELIRDKTRANRSEHAADCIEYLLSLVHKEWVGLTHEEHMEIMTGTMTTSSRMAAVEAKLKEKNT